MNDPTEYERGVKEGRVDALLDEHTARLNKINGSVERHARSNEQLAKAVRDGLEGLASEIRTMQEEARARDLAVTVTAETLAKETERRREEIAAAVAASHWRFTRRQLVAVTFLMLAAILVTVFFSLHT